jgi:hypothetical protein
MSWKQYGGTNNFERASRINTQSLTANQIIFKEAYNGNFDICGGFQVSENASISGNLSVNGVTVLNNNVTIGQLSSVLDVNAETNFNNNITLNAGFSTKGSIYAEENAYIGNTIVYGNENIIKQFIYGDLNGIGINTYNPQAALDISSNQLYSILVKSSDVSNQSVLAQNVLKQGITVGVDSNSSFIYFNNDRQVQSGNIDASITYNTGGYLIIDANTNTNLKRSVTVSVNPNNTHVNGEPMTIYDISNGQFYNNIYNNSTSTTGSALSLIANDTLSNTFMYITTPEKQGLAVGGGAYPNDVTRSMGFIGLQNKNSDDITPVQTIVAGNGISNTYYSTTGINTFKPRIDNYVLDVNGPIHLDNGYIYNSTGTTPFEIKQLGVSTTNRANVIGIGSITNIQKNVIIRSYDYGKTWTTNELTVTNLDISSNTITSCFIYDSSNSFITGTPITSTNQNLLLYSYDSGNTFSTFSLPTLGFTRTFTYNNLFMQAVNTDLYGYFSIDASSTLIIFKKSLTDYSSVITSASNVLLVNNKPIIDNIKSIHASINTLWLAGNSIVKYNMQPSTTVVPTNATIHIYPGYRYTNIDVFDNSYAIAVGNNVISSTVNGGVSWTDISFNLLVNGGVDFTKVYIVDSFNAIAVGYYGNIWTTSNSGTSWGRIPANIINSSGKSTLVTSTVNMYKDVVMTDKNTILLVNTIVPFIESTQYGSSNIYNIFTPNYANRSNNIVLDVSGTINISGDVKISDGGSIVSTNTTFNLLNKDVYNINFGGDATQIIVGNSTVGNTIIRNKSIFNGTTTIANNTNSTSTTTGALVVSGGVGIAGNVNVNGNITATSTLTCNNIINLQNIVSSNIRPYTNDALIVGGPNSDVFIGGLANTNRASSIYIGQSTVTPSGQSITPSPTYPTTIYIGTTDDFVIIRGNLTTYTVQEAVVASLTTILNFGSQINPNVTCAGAGIDIFDNSGAGKIIGGHSDNIYSFIHVGTDMQSFVFKAPSYGAFDSSKNPLFGTSNPLQIISPENRLRIGVNELTLRDVSNNVKRGLCILQSDADFKAYQRQLGHSYAKTTTDADYVINLCPDFDISNILLKVFDTNINTQTIVSNLSIGNVSIPSIFSTYGNVILYGNVFGIGNTILSNVNITQTLTNSGTTIINGNLGILTDTPQYPLDVRGNSRFIGELISTNYDNVNFPTNYGTLWSDYDNTTAPTSSYYQDVTMSFEGKYQYAVIYNKFGGLSINKSINFGKNWSTVDLPSVYFGNSIVQAVPYMSNNTSTFTPSQLLQGNLTIPGAIPMAIQAGTYIASASTNTTSNRAFQLNGVSWSTSLTNVYTNGDYSAGTYTTNGIGGEWIEIRIPYAFILRNVGSYGNLITGTTNYAPTRFTVFGGNDGISWNSIVTCSVSPLAFTGNTFANSTPYSYYRVVITNVNTVTGTSGATVAFMNLGGVVQNAFGIASASISSSGTGQYVVVAPQGYINGNGNLFTSSNYGATFIDSNQRPGSLWQGISLSQTGLYQSVVTMNPFGVGSVGISSNFGSTWSSPLVNIINGFQSVALSSTGQYITAIQAGNVTNPFGNIWVSTNYGVSWSSQQQLYSYVAPFNGFFNLGATDFNKSIWMSTSGKYQTALALGDTSISSGGANIWINSNYGVGSWTNTLDRSPATTGNVSILSSVSMIGTGRYQVISYITGNTSTNTIISGNVLTSFNYGVDWSDVPFSVPTESLNSNIYNGFFPKIKSSENGQYILGITKYQDIVGSAYNNNNSTAVSIGNIFNSSVPVTPSLFYTIYMGSSNSGNVFQSHGLQLSVPNDNNASVMIGYDPAWDCGYINSMDEFSQNALCLNTTGGSIGIGKSNPDPLYALDISGSMKISGITSFASNAGFNSLVVTTTVANTPAVIMKDTTNNGLNQLNFVCNSNSSTNNYNLISSTIGANDVGIFFGAASNASTGGMVIAPWSTSSSSGIKLAPTTGFVGIGTPSPLTFLDVSNTIAIKSTNIVNYTQTSTLGFGFGGGSSGTDYRWKIDDVTLNRDGGSGPNFDYGAQSRLIFSCKSNTTYANSVSDRTYQAGLTLVPNSAGNGVLSTGINVGINTTTPIYPLDVTGDIRLGTGTSGTLRFGPSGGVGTTQSAYIEMASTGNMTILNQQNGTLVLGTNNVIRMMMGTTGLITCSAGLTVSSGTTSLQAVTAAGLITGSAGLTVSSGTTSLQAVTAAGAVSITSATASTSMTTGALIVTGGIGSSGQVNAASFNANSDYRLKDNIESLHTIGYTVDELKPIKYKHNKLNKIDMGFLAHEVQEIFPFLVTGEKDGESMQGLNYNGFIALLVKEIQDLKKQVHVLKEENTEYKRDMENRLAALEAKSLV